MRHVEDFGSGFYYPVDFVPLRKKHAKAMYPPPPPPQGLSEGESVGLTIAAILVGLVLAVLLWVCVCRRQFSRAPESEKKEAGIGARVRRKGFPGVLRMAGRDVTAQELQTLLPQAAIVAAHTNSALAARAREEAALQSKSRMGQWRRGS